MLKKVKLFTNKNKVWIILIVIMLVLMLLDGSIFSIGDGMGYYHVSKQMSTRLFPISYEEPEYYPYVRYTVVEHEGRYITRYLPGNGVLWFPFFMVSNIFDNGTIFNNYYKAFAGYSFADGFAVLLASVVYATFGIILLYKTFAKLGFKRHISILSIASVYLSTSIYTYIFESPFSVHSYEVFAINALFFSIISFIKEDNLIKNSLCIGITSGILFLIRPSNAFVIFILVALAVFKKLIKQEKKVIVKSLTFMFFSVLPFILYYLFFNYISFGNPFTSGYSVMIKNVYDPNYTCFCEMFINRDYGFLVYSPLLVLSLIGLIIYCKGGLYKAFYGLAPFLATIVFFSFWCHLNTGLGVGVRSLLVLIPFCALGVYSLLTNMQTKLPKIILYSFVIIATLYSSSFTLMNRFITQTGLDDWDRIPGQSRKVMNPLVYYYYHYDLIQNSDGLKDYIFELKGNLHGMKPLSLLLLGDTAPIIRLEQDTEEAFYINVIPNSIKEQNIIDLDLTISIDDEDIYEVSLKSIDTSQYKKIRVWCAREVCQTDWPEVSVVSEGEIYDKYKSFGVMKYEVKVSSKQEVFFVNRKLDNSKKRNDDAKSKVKL